MDLTTIIVIVIAVLIVLAIAFVLARRNQRSGSVFAAQKRAHKGRRKS